MKKSLLTSVLFMLAFSANSQAILEALEPNTASFLYRSEILTKNELSSIQGSTYYVDEFRLAAVDAVKEKIMLRYNAFTDMFEVQSPTMEVFPLAKKEPFNTITFDQSLAKIRLLDYQTNDKKEYGYLVELFSSEKIALYRRDRVILQKGREASSSYSEAVPSRFVKADEVFFISYNNKITQQFPRNKKDLLEFFPEKKTEIGEYIKKNNFSFKDEKSITNFIRFISEL